jgi:hypothetical protein
MSDRVQPLSRPLMSEVNRDRRSERERERATRVQRPRTDTHVLLQVIQPSSRRLNKNCGKHVGHVGDDERKIFMNVLSFDVKLTRLVRMLSHTHLHAHMDV